MNKIYLDPEIFYIENFISQEDIKIFLTEFEDKKNWTQDRSFFNKTSYSKDVEKLVWEYARKVEKLINDDLNSVNWNPVLQKYIVMSEENEFNAGEWAIAIHSDRFNPTYKDSHFLSNAYVTKGFILYFNDNYDGGEVKYLEKNISFRPKAGMILVHSGFEEYRHGVTKVTSGERYIITGFAYEKEYFESYLALTKSQ